MLPSYKGNFLNQCIANKAVIKFLQVFTVRYIRVTLVRVTFSSFYRKFAKAYVCPKLENLVDLYNQQNVNNKRMSFFKSQCT